MFLFSLAHLLFAAASDAAAPTRDGFVVANREGIAGIVSPDSAGHRAFATNLGSIKAIAVSRDGKRLRWATVAAQWRFGSCGEASVERLCLRAATQK